MTLPTEACLQAVSVGLPREVPWQGSVVRTGIFKSPVAGPVAVGPLGLEGDGQADLEVHGGIDKAVYAYDQSGVDYWRSELGRDDLGPGSFGENLTLLGVSDDRIAIGDTLRIGTVLFQVSQPRQPCFKLGLRMQDPRFPKRFLAHERVGFYLRVLERGELKASDPIELVSRHPEAFIVHHLVALWRNNGAPREQLERAASLEALAEAWREPFRERIERIG